MITWLLVTYNDAREPLRTSGGVGCIRGEYTSRALTMPASWSKGSYRELEDGLRLLRRDHKLYYWHVSHRYIRCRTGVIQMVVERNTSRGVLRETRPVAVDLYDPGVKPDKVERGVQLLSDLIPGPVWLPMDVLKMVS